VAEDKKNYRETIEGMGKREINALNREIRDHYTEHGWRKTVGEYRVSPMDLSAIVGDSKAKKPKAKKPKAKKPKTEKKAKAKPASKGSTKKEPKKEPKKKAKAKPKKADKKADEKPKKRGRPPKKDKAPKKEARTKTAKKRGRPKKGSAPKSRASSTPTPEEHIVLDYLLRRRKGRESWHNPETIDIVILELTAKIRGV